MLTMEFAACRCNIDSDNSISWSLKFDVRTSANECC